MRFIVLAPFASISADRDVALIELLGPHEATCPHALASADHPTNKGRIPNDAELHALVVLEIISGAVPVIHQELEGVLLRQLLAVCDYLKKPVITQADLFEVLLGNSFVSEEHIHAKSVLPVSMLPLPAPTPAPVQQTAALDTHNSRTLGDRWRLVRSCLLRWEQRINAALGTALKNPITASMQKPVPRPYVLRTTPLDTTG